MKHGVWSQDEHDRFLAAIKLYPVGPWRAIASFVGTRSVRQVQTHAQKYHEKVARRMRGLRKDRRKQSQSEHRIEEDVLSLCKAAEGYGIWQQPRLDVHKTAYSFAEPNYGELVQVKVESGIFHSDARVHLSPSTLNPKLPVVLPPRLPSFDESLDFFLQSLPSQNEFLETIVHV